MPQQSVVASGHFNLRSHAAGRGCKQHACEDLLLYGHRDGKS